MVRYPTAGPTDFPRAKGSSVCFYQYAATVPCKTMTLLFTSNIDGYGSYESWAISDVEVHLSGAALPSHSSSHGLIITHRL